MNNQSQSMGQKMSQSQTQSDAYRGAEMDELDFEDDKGNASFVEQENAEQTGELNSEGDQILTEASDLGLAGNPRPETELNNEPTNDDMSPETLIQEDGARSPQETGGNIPIDRQFSTVSQDEMGMGHGLDEAELARVQPLDGKQWDGNPDNPLGPYDAQADITQEYGEDIDLDEEEE